MNVHNMDFEDGTFDLVFSYDSFEHFEEPSKDFEEIIRVAKPGGQPHSS
jgi:ubiquinone/menaquinone biosynthesis C-methylase UbiE